MHWLRKQRGMGRMALLYVCLLLIASGTVSLSAAKSASDTESEIFIPRKKITKKERDRYYSSSAFVGNSVGVGLKLYFDSRGKGVCGKPVMLVRGCYSFANDRKKGSPYQIVYRGRKYRAKDAIAAARVKRVFINMGSNDLWKPSAQTYQDYVRYVKEIRKKNPNVIIFIQGTTPMCSTRSRKYLNNSAIRDLNQRMKEYCGKQKDMYYVDISEGLKTRTGGLQRKYSSDGYVHMTMSGYKIWTDNLNDYISKLLLREKNATLAVGYAAKKKTVGAYNTAKKLVERLDSSTVKQSLQKKLKQIPQNRLAEEDPVQTTTPNSESETMPSATPSLEPSPMVSPTPNPEPQIKTLKKISGLKLIRYSANTVKVTWKKHKTAKYFQVYYAAKKEGIYRCAGVTKKEYFFVKHLKKGKTYYFYVKACENKKASQTDSEPSQIVYMKMKKYSRKTIFAGDSICQGIGYPGWAYPWMDIGGKKKVIAYRGLNTVTFHTKRIFHGKTGLQKLFSESPYRVYMMLGMNELPFRNISSIIAEYKSMVQVIRQMCPDTDIVICAVSPVTRIQWARYPGYKKIPLLNKRLKKMAKKAGVRYFDYTGFLKDSSGCLKTVYAARDGYHWKIPAYKQFAKEVVKYEKSIDKN